MLLYAILCLQLDLFPSSDTTVTAHILNLKQSNHQRAPLGVKSYSHRISTVFHCRPISFQLFCRNCLSLCLKKSPHKFYLLFLRSRLAWSIPLHILPSDNRRSCSLAHIRETVQTYGWNEQRLRTEVSVFICMHLTLSTDEPKHMSLKKTYQ